MPMKSDEFSTSAVNTSRSAATSRAVVEMSRLVERPREGAFGLPHSMLNHAGRDTERDESERRRPTSPGRLDGQCGTSSRHTRANDTPVPAMPPQNPPSQALTSAATKNIDHGYMAEPRSRWQANAKRGGITAAADVASHEDFQLPPSAPCACLPHPYTSYGLLRAQPLFRNGYAQGGSWPKNSTLGRQWTCSPSSIAMKCSMRCFPSAVRALAMYVA